MISILPAWAREKVPDYEIASGLEQQIQGGERRIYAVCCSPYIALFELVGSIYLRLKLYGFNWRAFEARGL